ncbi:MAG: sugar ABC transporter substrate-binding protein [Jatrophihabitantaceae bacterium]
MRKKSNLLIVGIAGILVVALALTGCGRSGNGPGKKKDFKIGISFYSDVIPLYIQMKQGMQDKAKQLGVQLDFAVADNSAETQSNQINTFVTKGENLILCSPVDASALVPAYQAARSAGVPVISVANKVADADEDAYVGPDLVDQASRTMQKVVDAMGRAGDLMLITGPPQIAFVQAQKKGWQQVLSKYPNVHVVTTLVDNDLSTSAAVDLATTGLASNKNVKAILSSDDDISMGAIQAIQSARIAPSKIFTAGWDGSPAAINALKAGTYDLTLSQRGYTWGQIAMQTAVDYLNGKKPAQHRVNTPDVFIDQQNVKTLTAAQVR